MIPHPPHQARRTPFERHAGMTLIELLIAVVIMGVLLAVAFPSYMDSVRKGRRAEGIAALTKVQHAQERFRANSPVYGNLNAVADAATLPNPAELKTSANGRYTVAVSGNDAAGYTAIATAAGAQAEDAACKLMGVRSGMPNSSGNLRYGSGTTSIDWTATEPDSGRCWAK